MNEKLKYLLIIVATYVAAFLLRFTFKHGVELLSDTFLLSLAFALPLSIGNCIIYKTNKVKNKIKKKIEDHGF